MIGLLCFAGLFIFVMILGIRRFAKFTVRAFVAMLIASMLFGLLLLAKCTWSMISAGH